MDNVQGFGAPLPLEASWTAAPPAPEKKKKRKAPAKRKSDKEANPEKKIRTENLPWN
jgi:hypothetical protein